VSHCGGAQSRDYRKAVSCTSLGVDRTSVMIYEKYNISRRRRRRGRCCIPWRIPCFLARADDIALNEVPRPE